MFVNIAKRHLAADSLNCYVAHFSEFPGNWLSRNGAGAVPSNVDENDQGSDVDSSSASKGPIPIGRPEECPAHFSELESPCQVLENFHLKTHMLIILKLRYPELDQTNLTIIKYMNILYLLLNKSNKFYFL